jgi:hypothetical protein
MASPHQPKQKLPVKTTLKGPKREMFVAGIFAEIFFFFIYL